VNVPVAVPLHVPIGIELLGIVMVNVPPLPLNDPVMVIRAAYWNPPKPTVPVNELPVCVITHVMLPTEPIMPPPMPGPIEMPSAVPLFTAPIESAAVPIHVPAIPAPEVPVPGCVTVGVGDAGDADGAGDPLEQAVIAAADSIRQTMMEALM